MSEYVSNDDERNAYIDERFDEIYRFLRDLIDDPTPLSKIPDGSTLEHRTIQLEDRRVQLTAHRPSDSEEPWTARVTSWDSRGSLDEDGLAITAGRAESVPAPAGRVEEDELVQVAETADAALDALEQVIRQRPVLTTSGDRS